MSVYGIETGKIDRNTPTKPKNAYGDSKLQAEELISRLADTSFIIAILRPPMVYGKDCKGNYPRLAKLALKAPVFPNIDNKRSMIYIDNLSEFVKELIDRRESGLFFPQNAEYVNTSEMVRLIAEIHGKRIFLIKMFNPILKIMNKGLVNKVFGDLVYDYSIANEIKNIPFKKSIELTEKPRENGYA